MAEATSIAAASTEHINGHGNGGGRKPTVVIVAVDGSRTAWHAFDCEYRMRLFSASSGSSLSECTPGLIPVVDNLSNSICILCIGLRPTAH